MLRKGGTESVMKMIFNEIKYVVEDEIWPLVKTMILDKRSRDKKDNRSPSQGIDGRNGNTQNWESYENGDDSPLYRDPIDEKSTNSPLEGGRVNEDWRDEFKGWLP